MAGVSAPLQLFGDFGFSGGEDVAPNPLQDNQICINFYAEVNKQNAKEILGLLGCPGLVQLVAAPGGGAPALGSTTTVTISHAPAKIWENDSTGFPLYNGSSGNYVGIPSGISNSQVRIYDRNRTAAGYVGGDGNTYVLRLSDGAVQTPVTPTSFEAAIQTNNPYNAQTKFKDPNGNYAGLVMPMANGLGGVYMVSFGTSSNAILQSPTRSGSIPNPGAWTMDYATGTAQHDVIAALSTPPGITGTWKTHGIFPAADWQHVCIVTTDVGGTGNSWLHIITIASNYTATELARYQFTALTGNTFEAIEGFFNYNGYTALSTWDVAMMESNLQSMWVGISSTNTLYNFQISGSAVQSPTLIASAFNTTPGGTLGIFADGGNCLWTDFTRYALFSTGSSSSGSYWAPPSAVTNLPVRGTWELPNDATALAVIGNTCYLVTVASPAIGPPFPPAFATLALTSVGTLLTSTGPVSIRDNNAGGYAVIVDGPYGYLYNIATQTFNRITDPGFLGADRVAFIDGWWVFNRPGTQTFYTNFPQYGTGFNASYFALKDGAADNLVAVMENKQQLWLIGDKTTEIWYDAGGQYFPFQRLVGSMIQAGCKAKYSVARFSSEAQDGLIWFGRSERGENAIIRTKGFSADVVSTPAFSKEVATYPITADATGYTYQEDTHEFYVLTFPTADVTWCFDAQTGLLHKRLSYDPYAQQFHRHRSNCFMNFQGMRIVGDYQCGSLYQLTRSAYSDAGWPLLAKRRSPHIWDKGQRGRVFMASLQLDFQPGVGNPSGLGSNPQAGIAISRDGGKTFGQRWYAPIGQIGQYKTRTMWRRLAFGRDNVVDVEVIDPVPRDLVGVTLKAFSA
jgi:hypothetical protein